MKNENKIIIFLSIMLAIVFVLTTIGIAGELSRDGEKQSTQVETVVIQTEDVDNENGRVQNAYNHTLIPEGREEEVSQPEEETAPEVHTTGNEELDGLCQMVIDVIITDDMTDREKLLACYRWIENNFTYVHRPDYETWQEGAIDSFRFYGCDCYGFYATLRAFYEYLGFECKETTSIPKDHYWLRVKFEGRWYHCDVTNTWGPEERFLYTNKQLLTFAYDKPGYGYLWYEWEAEPEYDPEDMPEDGSGYEEETDYIPVYIQYGNYGY